jgi:DNA replication protein DnaC
LLKLLRLSGILDSLAARNREAVEGKLAYTEFLALVIQDEVARREQKKFASRVRRAGFRGEKTLEGFDFTLHPQLNQELIRDLATCRFVEEKVSLLIAGAGPRRAVYHADETVGQPACGQSHQHL